jgi:hypothetical protein
MNGRTPQRTPAIVAWLGYGGLIPFVGLALAGGILRTGAVTQAMIAYGAVILSFVGALHWAFAMTVPDFGDDGRRHLYIWSVVPALLAWVCLLLPPRPACLGLVAGFLLHYGWDRRLPFRARLPAWYLPLRLRLTAIACLCLLSNALRIGLT